MHNFYIKLSPKIPVLRLPQISQFYVIAHPQLVFFRLSLYYLH